MARAFTFHCNETNTGHCVVYLDPTQLSQLQMTVLAHNAVMTAITVQYTYLNNTLQPTHTYDFTMETLTTCSRLTPVASLVKSGVAEPLVNMSHTGRKQYIQCPLVANWL